MSAPDWISEYQTRLRAEHILIAPAESTPPVAGPAHTLRVDVEDWGKLAGIAAAMGCRWAGMWGDEREGVITVNVCLEHDGAYLLVRTDVPLDTPLLPSHTPHFSAANRMERHTHDLLGLVFTDHHDDRRWTRHHAWAEDMFPLRTTRSPTGTPAARTTGDVHYPFRTVQGNSVTEMPVGPIHAGIIEPGHFHFHVVGEQILSLEIRLGYTHKGIEKRAVGRTPAALARLAARVSGDSTVAHTWAACLAMEHAAGLSVTPRANALRALLAERERVANHLGDIGAVCNDVGFSFAQSQFQQLRERWQRRSGEIYGHRLLMDTLVPGGVAQDLPVDAGTTLQQDHATLRPELARLYAILLDHPSLEDRLIGTGYLSPQMARRFGTGGYVGKASGQGFDVRRHCPYAPYDGLDVRVPIYQEGDVAARLRVRMDEVLITLDIMDRLLQNLPHGDIHTVLPVPERDAEGLAIIEGWRGEILCHVRFDAQGRIARFFPRDPSWFSWPTLEQLIDNHIVPDFPVCNKSINASYSGHDL